MHQTWMNGVIGSRMQNTASPCRSSKVRHYRAVAGVCQAKGLPNPGGRRPAPGFRASYRRAFGKAPNAAALYGYEAMNAVLDAIERSGKDAGSRLAVADAYRAGPGN